MDRHVKNPFEEYRAFSTWLISVPPGVAHQHLLQCLKDGGEDNMAYKIAEYYGIEHFDHAGIVGILTHLQLDSLKYDLKGFEPKD